MLKSVANRKYNFQKTPYDGPSKKHMRRDLWKSPYMVSRHEGVL